MLFQDIIFWFLAAAAIGASIGVVLVKDLFRAALLLVVVFVAVAGFFVMLSAEFLAVVQVLIYAGAIAILIIFAVMMTRDIQQGNLPNRLQIPVVTLAALLLAALVVVATATDWNTLPEKERNRAELVQVNAVGTASEQALEAAGFITTQEKQGAQEANLAELLTSKFVLPFEIASVLLLAATIGALALIRERSSYVP